MVYIHVRLLLFREKTYNSLSHKINNELKTLPSEIMSKYSSDVDQINYVKCKSLFNDLLKLKEKTNENTKDFFGRVYYYIYIQLLL